MFRKAGLPSLSSVLRSWMTSHIERRTCQHCPSAVAHCTRRAFQPWVPFFAASAISDSSFAASETLSVNPAPTHAQTCPSQSNKRNDTLKRSALTICNRKPRSLQPKDNESAEHRRTYCPTNWWALVRGLELLALPPHFRLRESPGRSRSEREQQQLPLLRLLAPLIRRQALADTACSVLSKNKQRSPNSWCSLRVHVRTRTSNARVPRRCR
eukprot:COSAG02_NODE_15462_length_1168_cov_4.595884_1_plen_212_part_00